MLVWIAPDEALADEAGNLPSSDLDPALDPSMRHLLDRIGIVRARVGAEVDRRRAEDPAAADDRFLGLYVSDDRVDQLLSADPLGPVASDPVAESHLQDIEAVATAVEAAGGTIRLRRLARIFALEPLDLELLLIALAPDVDVRFEPLYGYLNDDVSLRRATVGLALRLCGYPAVFGAARARLTAAAPLTSAGLLTVEGDERPQLTRTLRIPDRVIAHLLGDDAPDPTVASLQVPLVPVAGEAALRLERALRAGSTTGYVRETTGSGGASCAAAALEACGFGIVGLDLERLDGTVDAVAVATAAGREARLRGAGLVAGPIEALVGIGPTAVRAFAELDGVVILTGRQPWDPSWSRDVPVLVEGERVDERGQARAWSLALGDGLEAGIDPTAATSLFRLTPEQIVQAARSARQQAAAAARGVSLGDIERGARSQNAAGLQRLARRIEPRATWDDLVLPATVDAQLRELVMRWRHRDQVLDGWGMGAGAARGRGVSALFAGGSGTGKTLSAEVIASDLGLDLYVVDLSTVVDKYIGETSKNLERIFDEADRVNGVLLFDEADALFGKRSAVSDSKDRHANVEVAFLLQRMEAFDGVAVLTTNLAANLDEAFIRRLDAIVDFPTPDEGQRRALWAAKLRPELPLDDDIDLDVLADLFKLSGSEIRNAVVSAAYRAADDLRRITMQDLIVATIREHRKLGRHLSPSEMGEYRHLLDHAS